MKPRLMKSTLLLSSCLIFGCNPSEEISEEATVSHQREVVIAKDEPNSTERETSLETIGDESEISAIGSGPDEEGLELDFADDGSGKIISYLWYDGFATDDCTEDVIVEFRVATGTNKTQKDLFKEYPEMNSFMASGRSGWCINTK